jgi:hypothetical protein
VAKGEAARNNQLVDDELGYLGRPTAPAAAPRGGGSFISRALGTVGGAVTGGGALGPVGMVGGALLGRGNGGGSSGGGPSVGKTNAPPAPKGVFDSFVDDRQRDLGDSQRRSDSAYDSASRGFNDVLSGHDGSGANRGYYDEFARTGGWDPSRIADVDSDIAGFRDIGRYGARDQASADRLRGGGVYDEFSKTGGYSDTDRANIRDRATSQVPAFYGALKDELSRQNTSSGGYNVGLGSQMSKLARESGRAGVDAAKGAELDIMDRVNSGRQWGTEGMSSTEKQIVNNQLAGLGGASTTELGLQDSINRGRMFGIEGGTSLDNAGVQNRLAAASGLTSLRSSTPGEVNMNQNNILQALGLRGSQIQNLIGQRIGNNPNTSWTQYLPQILGAAGTVAGGAIGGPAGASAGGAVGGSIGPKPQPKPQFTGQYI